MKPPAGAGYPAAVPKDRPKISHRYSLAVTRHRYNPTTWMWEILRTPQKLGVRLYGDNFQSAQAAKLSGERALRELLKSLGRKRFDG
jgi:hypothetical protein